MSARDVTSPTSQNANRLEEGDGDTLVEGELVGLGEGVSEAVWVRRDVKDGVKEGVGVEEMDGDKEVEVETEMVGVALGVKLGEPERLDVILREAEGDGVPLGTVFASNTIVELLPGFPALSETAPPGISMTTVRLELTVQTS